MTGAVPRAASRGVTALRRGAPPAAAPCAARARRSSRAARRRRRTPRASSPRSRGPRRGSRAASSSSRPMATAAESFARLAKAPTTMRAALRPRRPGTRSSPTSTVAPIATYLTHVTSGTAPSPNTAASRPASRPTSVAAPRRSISPAATTKSATTTTPVCPGTCSGIRRNAFASTMRSARIATSSTSRRVNDQKTFSVDADAEFRDIAHPVPPVEVWGHDLDGPPVAEIEDQLVADLRGREPETTVVAQAHAAHVEAVRSRRRRPPRAPREL